MIEDYFKKQSKPFLIFTLIGLIIIFIVLIGNMVVVSDRVKEAPDVTTAESVSKKWYMFLNVVNLIAAFFAGGAIIWISFLIYNLENTRYPTSSTEIVTSPGQNVIVTPQGQRVSMPNVPQSVNPNSTVIVG